MYNKILFATTASPSCDNAAKVAFDMADKYDSRLFVFHVLGVPSRGFSQTLRDVRTGEEEVNLDENYLDLVREEIKHTYEKFLIDDKMISVDISTGVPAREILRKARQEDADLIIMGANTREEDASATRYRSVVGNTMRKVAKAARCPVVIVSRPCTTCWKLFSNIVLATDFSKAADSAFEYAYRSAKAVGAKLYIFHAVNVTSDPLNPMPQSAIESAVADAKEKIQKRYVSKMEDFDNFDVEIWEGTPYVEILKFAREKQADLIVMAHHAKEIIDEEAELGSTVEQVVLRSACPVASVNHPDKLEDIE